MPKRAKLRIGCGRFKIEFFLTIPATKTLYEMWGQQQLSSGKIMPVCRNNP
jgi:hypothetical protein